MPITVLVVDDQAMVRQGFSALLAAQDDMSVVGDAGDGAEAIRAVAELRPDVVLMDVRMPGTDGLTAARRILSGDSAARPRILMLTTFDLDDYVYEALRAGCSGFLLKDAPAAELVRAVRVVAEGEALLAPSVTRRLVTEVLARRPAQRAETEALRALTAREREVLEQVATGRSNAEIAEELVVSEETVRTHVARMLAKLGLRDRVQAVVFAFESGVAVP